MRKCERQFTAALYIVLRYILGDIYHPPAIVSNKRASGNWFLEPIFHGCAGSRFIPHVELPPCLEVRACRVDPNTNGRTLKFNSAQMRPWSTEFQLETADAKINTSVQPYP